MTFVEIINAAIRERLARADRVVCFGQNITVASCLSGLTRDLAVHAGIEAINTPNCENAMAGFGFGLMLEGVDSIFFVKQLDFLLLAADQMVNTWNMARQAGATGSFTIVPIVVDSGFEGPQSRLNNLADFCSLGDFEAYALSDANAAETIIARHLVAPGFRLLAPSQRLFRSAADQEAPEGIDGEAGIFKLASGDAATVVAFNFAWPQARSLRAVLAAAGHPADLFGVAAVNRIDWTAIAESVARTGRLILIDDSRSMNRPGERLRSALADRGIAHRALPLYRRIDRRDLSPNPDRFVLDEAAVLEWIARSEFSVTDRTIGHAHG
ncbi:hypothetical protein [Jiella marina]|uniref:hypothetical protein n=1 Tax=Jiella sp. LLJ827 TaxID=2917712 RepID=UPI0021008BFF|nr:hypothetical protein [Jiella sp. LLJ827]MCQ0987992.1 hypothetical protein [Jiella sp. LLJ827]